MLTAHAPRGSRRLSRALLLAVLALAPAGAGCRSPYYWTMERLGFEKRDILVDRVEEGREAQAAASEQFRSALEAFRAVHDFDGGDLEQVYDRLNAELGASERRAEAVRDRIASIERVARDLFEEWDEEIATLRSDDLRGRSEELKRETEDRYESMITAMRKAEERMDPVLASFRDHVLFLKHNLDARAIASLSGELRVVETSIDELIRDMEASIAEADAFLAGMS